MSTDSNLADVPWVIESKFLPNRPRLDLVRRDRLLTQLCEAETKKLGLIIAPAGYGKSSLLGQWTEEADKKNLLYGWLTLESGEADEKQFLAYLVLLLSRIGLRLDDLETGARDGFSDSVTSAVLTKLIRKLNESDEKFVLILEDYHHAECDQVNQIIKRLIRETLSNFTIFIDSRRQPDIDAFSLIASGEALEIGASQLRLTKAETLKVLGGIADEDSGIKIFEQTEGWPVAVQLALVQKRAQPSAPILAGVDGGVVASYLTEQILSTLSPEAQELLLAVAFLERFNPELTNHVLASDDAWGRMDSISSFAPLVVPLDIETHWYRLHHLFAEYLRDMQIRRDHAWANKILMRASAWYAAKKQVVDAVRYAARAKDYGECERLILSAGGWKIILTEGIGILRSALRQLPDDIISASPRLLVARAYLHSKDGEVLDARALLNVALDLADSESSDLLDMDLLVIESMVNVYEDGDKLFGDFPYPDNLDDIVEQLDALGQGTIKCGATLTNLSRGEFDKANAELRNAFALMRQSGSVLGLNYCYIHAAHIALHRGDLALAAANIDRAGKMADENFGSDSGLKAVASVLEFSLRVWKGECGAGDLDLFSDALFQTVDNDGWVDIYITGLAAIVMLARQSNLRNEALKAVQRMRIFAEQRNLSRLERFADSAHTFVYGTKDQERESVNDCESAADTFGYALTPRDWQSYIFSACALGWGGEADRAEDVLTSAMALARRIDAGLWASEISLAKVGSLLRSNNMKKAQDELLISVKAAMATRLIGPFLTEEKILRMLDEVRSSLRHDEGELVTLQFVNEILERAKKLNPSKDPGILSEREYEVLQKLAGGLSNKEIARSLELTENTVKFHLKSLFSKLSVSKRTQAVVEAQRRGLID